MKKSTIITIVIILVVFLILLGAIIGGVFLFVNKVVNAEKTPITVEQFSEAMRSKGYTIYDAKSQFSSYNYIEDAYIAKSKDSNYQIEFYELSDEQSAISFYNNNKSIFESSKTVSTAETTSNLKNSSKYTLQSNQKYMVVSRVDNTVIYVKVDEKYKDTIKDILKELGY